VGGTEFIVDAVTEAAWVSSDGGFSNIFQGAKYQDAAVEAYFRTVGANASSRSMAVPVRVPKYHISTA
jgi:hypothetical protein